jgi:hypothetical protein
MIAIVAIISLSDNIVSQFHLGNTHTVFILGPG